MWDGFFILLLLCVVMATASILAGLLPLSFALSKRQLRFITALGTGVLVGTSLVVIIPEGIETLYSSSGSIHGHEKRALSGFDMRKNIESTQPNANLAWTSLAQRDAAGDSYEAGAPAANVGDFITGPDDGFKTEEQIAADLSKQGHPSTDAGHEEMSSLPPSQHSNPSVCPSSTTVGLVIHACADGIALGASSSGSPSGSGRNLSVIIFFALMIHKAPAAFGLTTTLLKQGLSKRAARAHLIVFALAAPAGALITWAAVMLLGYGGLPESVSAGFVTGILLLFSGGTFLYVAMHTMQDAGEHAEHAADGYAEVPMNGYGEDSGATGKGASEGGVAETFVTVGGMMLPLLFNSFGHGH